MRKSYTRGSRGLMLLSVLLLVFSLFSWFNAINNMRDVKDLYQEGKGFDGHSGYSIIEVIGIEELAIKDKILGKNEKFYLVETENAFLILKSTRKALKNVIVEDLGEDGKLRKFVDTDVYARIDAIPEKTRRRRSTTINISEELKGKFSQAAEDSILIFLYLDDLSKQYKNRNQLIEKIKEKAIYTYLYIEPTDLGYHVFNVIISSGLSIVTFFVILEVVKRIRWAKKSYEKLFTIYPEIEWDRKQLFTGADYVDKRLKVVVYKNSIIVYRGIFEFEEFNQIKRIVFDKLTS